MTDKINRGFENFMFRLQKFLQADIIYIVSNTFWKSINFTATSLFSLILIFFFANFLPKETYGTYRYVMSLSGALGFLTLSGMTTAVTQAVARGHEGVINYAIKMQLKWNLLFLAASSAIGAYYLIKGNSLIGLSIMILGAAFPFISAFNTSGHFLSGKKEFKKLSVWGIYTTAVYVSSMILAIILSKNVIVLVITYSLANLLTTLYIYKKTMDIFKPSKVNPKEEKEVFKYGTQLSLVNILPILAEYIDKILIFQFLGSIELAVYGLALAVPERIRGFIKGINSITLPKLAGKKVEDIKPLFYKRIFQATIIGTIITLLYILVSYPIFKIFMPQYLESIRYSQVISFYFILALPMFYIGSVFHSQKMIKALSIFSAIFNILKIALFFIFGALFGIWGMVYAYLSAYLAGFFFYLVLWELESRKQKKNIAETASNTLRRA